MSGDLVVHAGMIELQITPVRRNRGEKQYKLEKVKVVSVFFFRTTPECATNAAVDTCIPAALETFYFSAFYFSFMYHFTD